MPGASRREGRSGAAGLIGRLRGEEGLTDQAGLAAGGDSSAPGVTAIAATQTIYGFAGLYCSAQYRVTAMHWMHNYGRWNIATSCYCSKT
jgi:hypothetical protein